MVSTMKIVWLVFACSAIYINCVQCSLYFERHGLPPADPPKTRAASPLWGNITQKLDHFNSSNLETWTMRYMYNGQFFRANGPIFIMLGAEWTIEPTWLQSGQMYDMAQKHGAFMFYTEHRFYGQSMPRRVLTIENLKYLNTDLALADVAYFIKEIKRELPYLSQSKVIVFGGSYGGNMAIWIREKYPELVYAAVSSSAPVLAQVDFKEFYESVHTNLGTECSSAISKGIQDILKYLRTPSGVWKVQRDFNTCKLLDTSNTYDIEYFFMMIASRISNALQYGDMSVVTSICNQFIGPSNSSYYERLANFFRTEICLSNYNDLVKEVNILCPNGNEVRQWTYQTCTEFGYFRTTSSPNQPFGKTISVDMYYQWCLDFFGPEFTAEVVNNGVARTNAVYQGLRPNVTRVVTLHGTLDPWFTLGLSRNPNPSSPVIIINGTSHCTDMYSISPFNSEELRKAKLEVQKYVSQWIQG